MLGIHEYPTAFYFDRAVTTFGAHLEGELEKASEGKKSKMAVKMRQNMILARYLKDKPKFAEPPRR